MSHRNMFTSATATLLSALGISWSTKHATAATRGQLEVRAVEGMGRGIFARTPIRAGAVVLRDYTLPVGVEDKEHAEKTVFNDYYFVSEEPSEDGAIAYLVLGLSSLLNHSAKAPNVEQEWALAKEGWIIEFTALRNIRAGEQLFFDYGFDEDKIPAWADNYVKN